MMYLLANSGGLTFNAYYGPRYCLLCSTDLADNPEVIDGLHLANLLER